MIKNKRILFFSPSFFGYEIAIKRRLEEFGNEVVSFDERPSNSFWGKALLRKNSKFVKFRVEKYYKAIYSELNSITLDFDYILILNPEAMPVSFLEIIKKKYEPVKIVLYMWDSIRNKPNAYKYFDYCDKILSFDQEDVKLFPRLGFRPLFYLNEYAKVGFRDKYKYNFCFIGSAKADRTIVLRKIEQVVKEMNKSFYKFLYLQSKKLYVYYFITNSNFRHSHLSDFNYVMLRQEEVLNVMSDSQIIIDILSPQQTGLTIRTIETIGCQRKLITTNGSIIKYDFYTPQNILVIDSNNPSIPIDFVTSPYNPLSKECYYKYSLDGWLDDLFV